MNTMTDKKPAYASTRNACSLCAPLGAVMVYRGIEGCVPLVHGSQGCSTYIRRYIISHFREPLDVASSNFTEYSAIFGGEKNLSLALENIMRQYRPQMIGIASSCLSETIGDDVAMYLRQFFHSHPDEVLPDIVYASTPSYRGTHMDGFYQTVATVVRHFSAAGTRLPRINLFPGFLSSADIRHLKSLLGLCGMAGTVLPDYSESLDGQTWTEYQLLPPGGTPLSELRLLGQAAATIEFGRPAESAAAYLEKEYAVAAHQLDVPIGVRQMDAFVAVLEQLAGRSLPPEFSQQRGRLLDAYIDAHKLTFEKKALLIGDEDLVVALAAFLDEIGMVPALCATAGRSGQFAPRLRQACANSAERIVAWEGADYMTIAEQAPDMAVDIVLGSSKAYYVSQRLKAPLVRVGFPVHDRIGGQRLRHVGYEGTQQLFDRIVNALLEVKQEQSGVGYMYY